MLCWACSANNVVEGKVYRQDTCSGCRRPLHCCKNCHFYDEKTYNQCREPAAERVTDKEAANFCEYFKPAQSQAAGDGKDPTSRARKKLDDLFK